MPAGGDAYERDVPDVKVKHLEGAGHFLLETHLVASGASSYYVSWVTNFTDVICCAG